MAKVNVEVGAKLAPGFRGTLQNATGAVAGMAMDMQGPLRDMADGASATQASFNLFREFLLTRFLGPLGAAVVSLGGVSAAMWLLNRASGETAKSLQEFSVIENLEGQFRPLLGSIAATKARLSELSIAAAETPFELPELAAASKTLEVLTRGALSTGQGLRMVGDLSAQSGRPIQELSMWVGRLYDGLQSGRPVGEAMMRLQELGLVSGATRSKIEEMQKAGKAGNEVWQVMVKEFERASGSMEILSQSLTGLRSTLEDAKSELYREMGKSFAEQEKEAIRGATEVTEKFIPVAAEMMKTLSGVGLAQTPGQWVPFFDQELKKFLSTALSAKEVVLGLWRALVILGTGFAVATILGAVAATISFVTWLKAAITESRAFAAAKAAENAQWQWSIQNIRANTAALQENLQAAGRSRVAAMAQAAAMTAGRTAAGYLAAGLRSVAAAFVNPITLILMAATALWQWIRSIEEANKKADEFNEIYNDAAKATAKQIKDIQTLAEKAAFLAAQYEELRKVREKLSQTDDKKEVQHLRDMESLLEIRIRQAESLSNTELKAGQDRQQLLEDLKKLEKEYAEGRMKDAEKLAAKEKEISDLQVKRAELAKAAADAEKAANAESVKEIEKLIAAQRKIISESEGRLVPRNGGRGEAARVMRSRPEEERIQNNARSRISDLQGQMEGRTATEEASKTALQSQDNELRKIEMEAQALRDTVKAADEKARIRAAELYTEAKLQSLQSTGAQKVADEITLRQRLLALKIHEADAAGRVNDAAELKNEFAANENRLIQANKSRHDQLAEERRSRMVAQEERMISQLPKQEQAAALKKKENDLNAEAAKLEKQAASARMAGRDAESDELQLKAEKKRSQADQYGFKAEDVSKQAASQPVVSSMARVGGAAGESSAAVVDVAKRHLKTSEDIKIELAKVAATLETLQRDMKSSPEWDRPDYLEP